MSPLLCLTGGNTVVVLYPFSSKIPPEFVFQPRKWSLIIIEPQQDLHLCSKYFGNPLFFVSSVVYLVVKFVSPSFVSLFLVWVLQNCFAKVTFLCQLCSRLLCALDTEAGTCSNLFCTDLGALLSSFLISYIIELLFKAVFVSFCPFSFQTGWTTVQNLYCRKNTFLPSVHEK